MSLQTIDLSSVPASAKCPICLDGFSEDTGEIVSHQERKSEDTGKIVTPEELKKDEGSHIFHKSCLKKWVMIDQRCPIDRSPLELHSILSLKERALVTARKVLKVSVSLIAVETAKAIMLGVLGVMATVPSELAFGAYHLTGYKTIGIAVWIGSSSAMLKVVQCFSLVHNNNEEEAGGLAEQNSLNSSKTPNLS